MSTYKRKYHTKKAKKTKRGRTKKYQRVRVQKLSKISRKTRRRNRRRGGGGERLNKFKTSARDSIRKNLTKGKDWLRRRVDNIRYKLSPGKIAVSKGSDPAQQMSYDSPPPELLEANQHMYRLIQEDMKQFRSNNPEGTIKDWSKVSEWTHDTGGGLDRVQKGKFIELWNGIP